MKLIVFSAIFSSFYDLASLTLMWPFSSFSTYKLGFLILYMSLGILLMMKLCR